MPSMPLQHSVMRGHQTLSLWWVVARPSTLQKPSSSDWRRKNRLRILLDSKAWMDTELVPLVAIPTTTGTGSETTQFAVIYRDNIKHSLSSAKLLPNHVFLVPKFTQAQPFPVRAAAGFDALSQAIESYWSGHGTTESDKAALDAIPLAASRLTMGLVDFTEEVAADMQEAAHLAGIAINTTKTTAPHALSYALTTDYGVDHGHAVGLLLPKIWRLHNRMAAAGTLPAPLKHRMQDISDRLGVPSHEVPGSSSPCSRKTNYLLILGIWGSRLRSTG